MAMRTIPVNFPSIRFLGTREKMRDNERQKNAGGMPAWSVDVQVSSKDKNGYPSFENIAVTVYSHDDPAKGIQQLAPVAFDGLEAGAYANGQSTGFYFTAESLEKIPAQKAN